jgi:hypothetical protein
MFPFLWVPELSPATATSFSHQQLTVSEPQQFSDCSQSQSQSQIKVMLQLTVQSASLSWNKAPIFITVRQLQACLCGALSLTRGWVCRLPYSVSSNKSLVSMYIWLKLLTSPGYNISAQTTQKTSLPSLLCFLVIMETCLFVEPLLSNGCCIVACFVTVA